MKKLITILLFFSFAVFPQSSVEDIKTFTLENGMKIIVLEDHSIPNANIYLFYKVGSRNEYPGITGISHFFEHMMFNGAKKYGPKEFDRVMKQTAEPTTHTLRRILPLTQTGFPTTQWKLCLILKPTGLLTSISIQQ